MGMSTQHVQKMAGTHAVSTSACEQSDRYLHNIIMSLQNTPSAHTSSPMPAPGQVLGLRLPGVWGHLAVGEEGPQ